LKDLLDSSPTIQKPNPEQPIRIYLSVFEDVVSAALIQDIKKEEYPIYFVI